ncbi:MAG: periplasmic heavy metal sensor [Limisphaerales bacterium]
MKKGIFILVVGLALAAAAYGCVYFFCTSSARNLERSSQPELAWLKEEFHLSDAEFKRISELHASYLPQCAERCRQIAVQNQRVKALLAATNQMTPEIEAAVAESARLRVECQRNMLRHFYEVSRTMPPEEGRRYLAWVQERTFLCGEGMMGDK